MRRCRQQHQVSRVILQGLRQLVVLGLPDLATRTVGGQVVSLVEYHQVPARCGQQPLYACRALECVNAGDEPIVLGEGVSLAVGDVALRAEHLEFEVEHFIQLAVPIVHQPCRHYHQRAHKFTPAGQLSEDERSFDGLAQPHLVGNQIAPW